jgi:predicted MFS family arabinose efflux permease
MALFGGYAILSVGYRSVFLVGMGCMAAGSLVFWVYFRMHHAELGRAVRPRVPEESYL